MVRWKRGPRSDDLIDRRGESRRAGMPSLPLSLGLIRGLGLPGLILVIGLFLFVAYCQGDDPASSGDGAAVSDSDAELVDFMSFVLDDVQDEWTDVFQLSGREYERAELVLFDEYTSSACGGASEAIGPHYCPVDRRVYLDLGFFRELSDRMGAKGDFAQAYVIAHEIGHHVQNLLGTMEEVQVAQSSGGGDPNELSIRLELQADCYAGVWGYSTFQREILESGDLQEAMNAAAAVGDDRIQESIDGRVDPESWTHGSSEQRMTWFETGFDSGDPADCDTFTAAR